MVKVKDRKVERLKMKDFFLGQCISCVCICIYVVVVQGRPCLPVCAMKNKVCERMREKKRELHA